MSDPNPHRSDATSPTHGDSTGNEEFPPLSREEMQSALFAQLVMQQSSMAMMLLGRTPNPQTGKTMRDLESARLFIDQLEMLEVKTRGNLTSAEDKVLKQTLLALRMAFVETSEQPPMETQPTQAASAEKPASSEAETGEESKKRFSKKFSL